MGHDEDSRHAKEHHQPSLPGFETHQIGNPRPVGPPPPQDAEDGRPMHQAVPREVVGDERNDLSYRDTKTRSKKSSSVVALFSSTES